MFLLSVHVIRSSICSRRRKLLYELNSTGKYFAFKEQLKHSVIKIVREKFLRTSKFTNPDEFQVKSNLSVSPPLIHPCFRRHSSASYMSFCSMKCIRPWINPWRSKSLNRFHRWGIPMHNCVHLLWKPKVTATIYSQLNITNKSVIVHRSLLKRDASIFFLAHCARSWKSSSLVGLCCFPFTCQWSDQGRRMPERM